MKNVIVVPTHRTGHKFLENLLKSFKGYNKYPILVVINEYKEKDLKLFSAIIKKFDKLPTSIEKIKTNSFEMGGLYTAYIKTDYDNFFLLPHSCEILNIDLFNLVFEKHKNKSVAFALQNGSWNWFWSSLNDQDKKFVLDHLDKDINNKLLNCSNFKFWQGHIGKYRKDILDKMNLLDYLPNNMIEAMTKSELLFTTTYHSLDKDTIVLFPEWKDNNTFEKKFGKKRLKIVNEYLIKWKSHYSLRMGLEYDKNKVKKIK